MSDQETETNEEPTPQDIKNAADKAVDKPEAATGKSSSAIAWLALLLGVALGGGAAWLFPQLQRAEQTIDQRLARLENSSGQEESNLEALEQSLQSELRSGLAELESAADGEAARLTRDLESLEQQMSTQRDELARFSASDRDSWLLAEAEYLLRLANQRLIMAGDTVAAEALLVSADKVLRELDDTTLHQVRGAVAADLAAVRAVPKIDVEGIYLRLAAQIERAGELVIFQLPEQEAQPRPQAAEHWRDRLRQGYEAALLKLSDYIIIRRRDVPMQALMDPQWEGLVRQNLRMLLEQAQVALLSGNQTLYSESLERAQHWLAQFQDSDEAAAAAMDRELRQMAGFTVAVQLPDISRSLQTLDDAIERRLQPGGDE